MVHHQNDTDGIEEFPLSFPSNVNVLSSIGCCRPIHGKHTKGGIAFSAL